MPKSSIVLDQSFDPESVRLISTAFDAVCADLGLNAKAENARQLVAKQVIALARDTCDPQQLRAAVLASFRRVSGSSPRPVAPILRPPTSAARRPDNAVLAGLPPSDLALLAPCLHAAAPRPSAEFAGGTFPPDCVYFPHEGAISLLAITPDGETIEIASAGRAGMICPITQSGFRDHLLVSTGAIRVSRVPIAQLQLILAGSERLSGTLEACRDALVLQLRFNLVCAGLHSAEQRLARWILEAADRIESRIEVTQEEVARRLGVRRTTVTLMAGRLQQIGAIHWVRGRVEISDRPRLEAAACACYRALRELIPRLWPT